MELSTYILPTACYNESTMNQWFKFYGGEYLSDPKIVALTASERSCWLTLLCYASMNGKDGVIKHLSEHMLMAQSGINPNSDEWKETEGVLKKLEELEIVTLSNETVTVTNWRKRQEMQLTGAERAKRFRERQKNVTEQRYESNARREENRIDKNKILDHFEAFWKEYPRKVSKKKAEQSWLKINPTPSIVQKIMASLATHRESPQWKKDDGMFIPHPTTWLNQERWNDEINVKNVQKTGKYAHL